MSPPKKALTQAIKKRFSKDELRDLCVEMGINYEELDEKTLNTLVASLLLHVEGRGQIADLLNALAKARPKINWQALASEAIQSPYRGLLPFREEDAHLFFGRDKYIERLLAAVEKRSLIAVLGPSGSGKSSVVFAGLLPRLRQFADKFIPQFSDLRIVLIHGSLCRINEYLYEDRPNASLERLLNMVEADVLVCGHTHKPYHRVLESGRQTINAGSVGKPKDNNPDACYIVLSVEGKTLGVQFNRVPHDVEAAAIAIEATEMPNVICQDAATRIWLIVGRNEMKLAVAADEHIHLIQSGQRGSQPTPSYGQVHKALTAIDQDLISGMLDA